jgi:hypothetical protein
MCPPWAHTQVRPYIIEFLRDAVFLFQYFNKWNRIPSPFSVCLEFLLDARSTSLSVQKTFSQASQP